MILASLVEPATPRDATLPPMSRADKLVAIGDTDHPPTEAMWEELEAEVVQIKRAAGFAHIHDRQALATDPAQQAIEAWERTNKLVARANPGWVESVSSQGRIPEGSRSPSPARPARPSANQHTPRAGGVAVD